MDLFSSRERIMDGRTAVVEEEEERDIFEPKSGNAINSQKAFCPPNFAFNTSALFQFEHAPARLLRCCYHASPYH